MRSMVGTRHDFDKDRVVAANGVDGVVVDNFPGTHALAKLLTWIVSDKSASSTTSLFVAVDSIIDVVS